MKTKDARIAVAHHADIDILTWMPRRCDECGGEVALTHDAHDLCLDCHEYLRDRGHLSDCESAHTYYRAAGEDDMMRLSASVTLPALRAAIAKAQDGR